MLRIKTSDLIEAVRREVFFETKGQAEAAVREVFAQVAKKIAAGSEVNVAGFGKFLAKDVKARRGFNPRTGKVIEIPARRRPVFKAGAKLKAAVRK
jgi:DNA-binding protein HU-beta